jgi:hypothetical protein
MHPIHLLRNRPFNFVFACVFVSPLFCGVSLFYLWKKYVARTRSGFFTCIMGPSWPWSHGTWIYNYLCNLYICMYLSQSKLRVPSPTHGGCARYKRYVIKFVSDLRQVGGFVRVLRFPLPIKLTATI